MNTFDTDIKLKIEPTDGAPLVTMLRQSGRTETANRIEELISLL